MYRLAYVMCVGDHFQNIRWEVLRMGRREPDAQLRVDTRDIVQQVSESYTVLVFDLAVV